jgi:nucleoside-diphosphate-sugar epimerase
MKLLVVGGAGHVGSVLRPALEREHECIHYDLRPVPGAEDRTILADVNDEQQVAQAVRNVEGVVYLAMGTVNHDRSTVNAIDPAFNVNVRGAYRFLHQSLAAGVRRFVYASSLSVYSGCVKAVDETVPADCWHPYGFSKRVGEFVCQAASQVYPDAMIVALRLNLPVDEEAWPRHRFDPEKERNSCALGPQDTRDLFLAAIRCDRPGCHILNTTGDILGKRYSNQRARTLLGWFPQNA